MKDLGIVFFVIGLGLIQHYVGYDLASLVICLIGFALATYGLDLVIVNKIDKAKEEMRKELDKKLEEMRG